MGEAPARVSIVIRTLGRRRLWLAAAMRSIERQTYPEIETVLVEDGPGALAELAGAHAARPGRSLRYAHALDLGMAKGGNLGLSLATGTLVGFLDDDDEFEPDHVRLLAEALASHPDWGAAVARARRVPVRSAAEEGWPAAGEVVGPERVSRALLHYANQMPIQSVLARKALLDRVGGFDPDLVYLEDWDLWLRATALMPFGTIAAVTSRFRVPASRRAIEIRAARHAPWVQRIRAKQAASGATVTSEDLFYALDALTGEVERFVPAKRLGRALIRRTLAAMTAAWR